jgi:hypothetical protein
MNISFYPAMKIILLPVLAVVVGTVGFSFIVKIGKFIQFLRTVRIQWEAGC